MPKSIKIAKEGTLFWAALFSCIIPLLYSHHVIHAERCSSQSIR